MKRILLIVAGIVGVLVGLGLILPAVALWRQGSPETSNIVVPLLFGGMLVLGALVALAKGASRSRA